MKKKIKDYSGRNVRISDVVYGVLKDFAEKRNLIISGFVDTAILDKINSTIKQEKSK